MRGLRARQTAAELLLQPEVMFLPSTMAEYKYQTPTHHHRPPSCPPTYIHSQVAQLPLNLSRGSWQHICVSWSQKGGAWQAYQGGKLRGEGHALAAGHHIRPGGVFVLGQEQVSLSKNGQ